MPFKNINATVCVPSISLAFYPDMGFICLPWRRKAKLLTCSFLGFCFLFYKKGAVTYVRLHQQMRGWLATRTLISPNILSHQPPACFYVNQNMTVCGGFGYTGWRVRSAKQREIWAVSRGCSHGYRVVVVYVCIGVGVRLLNALDAAEAAHSQAQSPMHRSRVFAAHACSMSRWIQNLFSS